VVLWIFAVLTFLVAVTAVLMVRRAARRLDALNQSYWELRYDYTRLRAQVARGVPAGTSEEAGAAAAEPEPQSSTAVPAMSFVPLSSIRKKES
jgi:hypothetical protein